MQLKTRKEIQQIAENVLLVALTKLKIKPSKKIRKRLTKTSRGLSEIIKKELKREKRASKSLKVKSRKKKSKATKPKSKGKA